MIEQLTILFLPRHSRKTKRGVPLYCRIHVGDTSVEFSTREYIDPKYWSPDFKRMRKKCHAKTNMVLDRIEEQINDHYDELLRSRSKDLSAIKIKRLLFNEDVEVSTLLGLSDRFITDMRFELAEGSMKNYRYTRRYLQQFISQQYRSKDYPLSALSMRFAMQFERYIKTQTDCTQNGCMKHLQRLKAILNYGVKLEFIKVNPFATYKIAFDKSEPKYISQEELERMERSEFDLAHLNKTRDLFLFGCYTGLSYVEVKNLRKDQVRKGFDGNLWIFTHRKKTGNAEDVPLLKQAKVILDRYHSKSELALPMPCNQVINRQLKEICKRLGINKKVSYHSARHTFATTVTLSNGIPLETLQRVLGHNSIRSTQIYGQIVNQKVAEDFRRVFSDED